jgi:hypothetical protein
MPPAVSARLTFSSRLLGLSCVVGTTMPADDGRSFDLSRIRKHQNCPAGTALILIYGSSDLDDGFSLAGIDNYPSVSFRNNRQLDASHEVFSKAETPSPSA